MESIIRYRRDEFIGNDQANAQPCCCSLISIDCLQHFLRIAMFLKCTHSWSYYRHSTSYYTFKMLPHIQQATTHSTNYYTSNKLLHIRSTDFPEHGVAILWEFAKRNSFKTNTSTDVPEICVSIISEFGKHIYSTQSLQHIFLKHYFFFPSTFLKI